MNSKGLEIVGVSLDRDMNSWRKAIEDDGLIWSQISNLQFWQDPIAKLYNRYFILVSATTWRSILGPY